MAHNTTINPGSGGDAIVDFDLSLGNVAYPTTGKVPAGVVFVSANNTTAPTPVTAANALYVQPGTGASFGVTGTVSVGNFPATQPVSGAVSVSNFPATQPVSAASLPLPAGAATSANQPGLGTAGAASANVLTVQGIAAMTALKVDGSAVTQPVSGTVNVGTLPAGTNAIGSVAPIRGAVTDRSGTITAGGTAQTLAPANANRSYLLIANPSTNTITLWVNFTTAAAASQPSIPIQPGGSFVMESGFVSNELISIFGATTSVPFTAKEG